MLTISMWSCLLLIGYNWTCALFGSVNEMQIWWHNGIIVHVRKHLACNCPIIKTGMCMWNICALSLDPVSNLIINVHVDRPQTLLNYVVDVFYHIAKTKPVCGSVFVFDYWWSTQMHFYRKPDCGMPSQRESPNHPSGTLHFYWLTI